jgi:hypothetical protein
MTEMPMQFMFCFGHDSAVYVYISQNPPGPCRFIPSSTLAASDFPVGKWNEQDGIGRME